MHAIGHLLTILIIQPIFNVLVLIEAILPGHNFGLSIIIFTCLVRLLMWPMVKKQLHQTRAMQKLQPDLKRIKAAAAGDRQKESRLVMELYKERGVNPFATLGIVLVQLPIFIALYLGVRRIVLDPQAVIDFSYSWLHNFSWIKSLTSNIHNFDETLFGAVDLTKKAFSGGNTYLPAILIAGLAAGAQYFQSKQLMPIQQDRRKLRDILGDASQGKSADQAELNAAVSRSTIVLIPVMVFVVGLGFPAALPLYWLTNSTVAYFQQGKAIKHEEAILEAAADATVESKPVKTKQARKNKSRKKRTKR